MIKSKIKSILTSPLTAVTWVGKSVNRFFEENQYSFTRLIFFIYMLMVGFVIWFIYDVVTAIVSKITIVDENAADIVGSVTLLLGAILTGVTVLAGMYQKIKGITSDEDEDIEEESIHDDLD